MKSVACPLCGCDDDTPVLRSPDWTGAAAGEFQVVRCRGCRHQFMNPAPVDSSIADCYPSDYGPHQRQLKDISTDGDPTTGSQERRASETDGEPPQPWYLSSFVRGVPGTRLLYRWVTDTKSVWMPPGPGGNKRALELGCSSGWFLAQLREQGWSPVGVDLVKAPLAQARDAGLEVHEGTLETMSFEEEAFDAVFAWMVIEHVPRPRETLREINRALRPGGWFAFSVPTVSCWEPSVFGRHWLGYELPRHLQHFSTRRLRSLLSEEGFHVEQVIQQPSFFNWLGSLSSWLETCCPRSSFSRRIKDAYEHNPPLSWYFVLGPLARLNAFLRQSGRLTVVTKRK